MDNRPDAPVFRPGSKSSQPTELIVRIVHRWLSERVWDVCADFVRPSQPRLSASQSSKRVVDSVPHMKVETLRRKDLSARSRRRNELPQYHAERGLDYQNTARNRRRHRVPRLWQCLPPARPSHNVTAPCGFQWCSVRMSHIWTWN